MSIDQFLFPKTPDTPSGPTTRMRTEAHAVVATVVGHAEREIPIHRVIDSLADRLEAAERERNLLRDKWNQMEAYGFDSPKAVFERIAALERENADLRRRFRETAVDIHVTCGHPQTFDTCPKHKCVHLREAVKP